MSKFRSRTLKFQAFEASRAFQEFSPLSTAGDASFFQRLFRRGPLRAGHEIPSRTEVFLIKTHLKLSGTSVWRPQSYYTMSRIECHIKFPQNQRCRAKIALHPPPKSRCRTFLRTPSHIPVSFAAGRGPGGGVSRRAGGGYPGTFGFRKGIALHGGVAATVTPIALHCATNISMRLLPEASTMHSKCEPSPQSTCKSRRNLCTNRQTRTPQVPPPTEKITKLIRQTFFPVITDFQLPIFPVIALN